MKSPTKVSNMGWVIIIQMTVNTTNFVRLDEEKNDILHAKQYTA